MPWYTLILLLISAYALPRWLPLLMPLLTFIDFSPLIFADYYFRRHILPFRCCHYWYYIAMPFHLLMLIISLMMIFIDAITPLLPLFFIFSFIDAIFFITDYFIIAIIISFRHFTLMPLRHYCHYWADDIAIIDTPLMILYYIDAMLSLFHYCHWCHYFMITPWYYYFIIACRSLRCWCHYFIIIIFADAILRWWLAAIIIDMPLLLILFISCRHCCCYFDIIIIDTPLILLILIAADYYDYFFHIISYCH